METPQQADRVPDTEGSRSSLHLPEHGDFRERALAGMREERESL